MCTDARQETAIIAVDPPNATTADGTEQQIIPNRYPYCTLHLPFLGVENSVDRSNVYRLITFFAIEYKNLNNIV